MASVQPQDEERRGRHHSRTKSAFKLFNRSPSKGATLPPALSVTTNFVGLPHVDVSREEFISSSDYPSSTRALAEIHQNQQRITPASATSSNHGSMTPRKSKDEQRKERGDGFRSLHKKTLSTLSLRSIKNRDAEERSPKDNDDTPAEVKKHKAKKSKSITNLAGVGALLSRPKSNKNLKKEKEEQSAREKETHCASVDYRPSADLQKENLPPLHDFMRPPVRPPIYAQYSSERFVHAPTGGRFREDHDEAYSPHPSAPFTAGPIMASPTLAPTSEFPFFPSDQLLPPGIASHTSSRPNSLCIPREYVLQDISSPGTPVSVGTPKSGSFDHPRSSSAHPRPGLVERSRTEPSYPTPVNKITMPEPIMSSRYPKPANMAPTPTSERTTSANSGIMGPPPPRDRAITPPKARASPPPPQNHAPAHMSSPKKENIPPTPVKENQTFSQRSAKMMNSMTSGFAYKAKEREMPPPPPTAVILPKKERSIDEEFEAMLDRRNIPINARVNMRKLDTQMKIELCKQDLEEIAAAKKNKERPVSQVISEKASHGELRVKEDDGSNSSKSKRPRSRTFTGLTFSKASKKAVEAVTGKGNESSPSKSKGHSRTKSTESMKSTKSTGNRTVSSSSGSVVGSIIEAFNGSSPSDFISYLRKPQKVEEMEVGKLHKLRLLLRNETVAWTDSFITSGGQDEIVKLLYRIMEVEWREEHEDQLLHEALLCLKALCTTALALSHLEKVQAELFPRLIHLIFDEEKKGPSEFSTRNVITSILFTYLQSAPLEQREKRAETLLTYLRDPVPKEEERPLGFVLQMHQERPYRVWCKEVLNVTKEVFWIFLHTLNVIATPSQEEQDIWMEENVRCQQQKDAYAYQRRHFPVPIPPVPTAPYVGSVEWEATNYITSHLFLMNGILASLPGKRRRDVRSQLRISRWERCMGDSLRLCKEKLYPGLHAALRDWVSAAIEDDWDVKIVSQGQADEKDRVAKNNGPRRVLKKGEVEAPRIDLPVLGGRESEPLMTPGGKYDDGGWL